MTIEHTIKNAQIQSINSKLKRKKQEILILQSKLVDQ